MSQGACFLRKPLALPSTSGGLGKAAALKSWGDGGSSKQRPAEQGVTTAKSCKLCYGSQSLAERGGTPFSPAEIGTFGEPRDQNVKPEIKELRIYLHYVKIKQYTNPCLARNQSI